MKKFELRKILVEAMDWQRNLTERQRGEITLAQAQEEKLNEIVEKYNL